MRTGSRELIGAGYILIVAFAFLRTGSVAANAQVSSQPVSIELEKATITQGEPVLADLKIKNITSENLDLDLGDNSKEKIFVTTIDPDGHQNQKLAEHIPKEGVFAFGDVHLKPQERYNQILILNEWFQFDKIGEYRITIGIKSPITNGDHTLVVTPVTVILEVTAKNSEQLATGCKELLTRIENRDRYAEADRRAAEQALSYVEDPIAVPYLEQALVHSSMGQLAIDSLFHIGNPDAVMALVRASLLPYEEIRKSARMTLSVMAGQTSDPQIKSQIEEALKQKD
jgi:hypothetical protein